MTKVYKTSSAAETIALGEEIGRRLKGGDLIAYSGGLGAGKTTIFNLITGVYQVTSGDIVFNGSLATRLLRPRSHW